MAKPSAPELTDIAAAEVITPTVASADLFKAEDFRDKTPAASNDDLLAEVNTDDIVSSDDSDVITFEASPEDSLDDDLDDEFQEDDLLDNFDEINEGDDDEGYF